MYKDIDSTIGILKNKGLIFWGDMSLVFDIISKYSRDNDKYYNSSADYELMDFSLESSWTKESVKDVFRASYFWTNLYFLKEVFLEFWYKKSFELFLSLYKKDIPLLKDDFVTCGFKFLKWNLAELKVYYDIKKSKKLIFTKTINDNLQVTDSEVLLKSFTFNKDTCIEDKIYIPSGKESLLYAEEKLKNNKSYLQFQESHYYDILYRYSNQKLESIKFYYNVGSDFFLKNIIKENIGNSLKKSDFLWLHVRDELGVDFNLNTWINKYNYYIWLYK